MTDSTPLRDDRLTLLALGGLAYLLTMLLHEALGHGLGCLIAGGEPVITAVATQCSVQSSSMVLAGPLLNWIAGIALWLYLPAGSRSSPHRWWLLWLLMSYNFFIGAGYLAFCGLSGFGDWAVLAGPLLPAWLWRPLAALGGMALYYLVLRGVSARLPALEPAPPGLPTRLRSLVLFPYLGAGLVACCAGLLNPIDPTRRFLLPIASAFGAGLGLIWVPDVYQALPATVRSVSERALGPVVHNAGWLVAAAIAIGLFVGLIGPGLALR